MMKKTWFKAMALLLVLLVAPVHTMAEGKGTTLVIPFTVNYTPGTVIMEAGENAPGPEVASFDGAEEGAFTLSFSEPGDYAYQIWQKAGKDTNIIYDDTVYEVNVYVRVNDDGALYCTVVVSTEDDEHKPGEIAFKNAPKPVVTPPAADPTDPVAPTDPVKPTDPVAPTDPVKPTDPADPTATSAPEETDSPTATPAPEATDSPTATPAPEKTDAPTPEMTDSPTATPVETATTAPGGPTDAPGPVSPSDPPKTGDDSQIWLWITLLAVSFVGIGVLVIRGGKKRGRSK